jgi:hypothetical protein
MEKIITFLTLWAILEVVFKIIIQQKKTIGHSSHTDQYLDDMRFLR